MAKYGELSRENIEYLTKRKIKCLCLGARETYDWVHCFELDDGNFVFPLYGENPIWKNSDNIDYVSINQLYLIKRNKTRQTGDQCWPMYSGSLHVNRNIFNHILRNYCDYLIK